VLGLKDGRTVEGEEVSIVGRRVRRKLGKAFAKHEKFTIHKQD
jgi:hypothetical protein